MKMTFDKIMRNVNKSTNTILEKIQIQYNSL